MRGTIIMWKPGAADRRGWGLIRDAETGEQIWIGEVSLEPRHIGPQLLPGVPVTYDVDPRGDPDRPRAFNVRIAAEDGRETEVEAAWQAHRAA